MSSERSLPFLRKSLALAENELRVARDAYAYQKAVSEQHVIEAFGGEKALGANSEARERALVLALDGDAEYGKRLHILRSREADVTLLAADLEGAKDVRREREWAIRERLAAALDSRAIQPEPDAEEPADPEFLAVADNFADDAIDELAEEADLEVRTAQSYPEPPVENDPFRAAEVPESAMPF
jgi:hypothetical protein